MNLKELRERFGRMLSAHQQGRSIELVAPAREWAIGLALGALVLAAAAGYAALRYTAASMQVAAEGVATSAANAPYHEEEVRAILDMYAAKAARFNELRGAVPLQGSSLLDRVEAMEDESAPIPSGTPVAE